MEALQFVFVFDHSNAEVRLQGLTVRAAEGKLGEFFAQAVGQGEGDLAAGHGQQQEKLVAAQAKHHVGFSGVVEQVLHRGLEDPVAYRVAEAVVDYLEVIQIEHQEREGRAPVAGHLPEFRQGLVQMAAVVGRGERIPDGLLEFLLGAFLRQLLFVFGLPFPVDQDAEQ